MGDFAGSTQVHDWEPGIESSGLFWTIPVPDSAVSARPAAGRARFRARDLAIPDYHDFLNSVGLVDPPIPTVPSHISFDVVWHGGGKRSTIRDTDYDFAGYFVEGPITIDFTARQDGSDVTYRSNPENQITPGGGVGIERNGVFFR